jgi:sister chromatid cohesion protein PDS5
MRLQAAVSLLHLSTVPTFASVISNNLVSLAITIQVWTRIVRLCSHSSNLQDPCYQVRDEFLRKFISLATHQQLPPHFNVIPFLTVHDPEADIKDMVRRRSSSLKQIFIFFRQEHSSLWHIVHRHRVRVPTPYFG